ncbi:MAG: SdpI family protein [Oscillospiraceae bacterium]|nr:SdpI family protein [Oscillospiraceae bacterium]
MDLDALMAIFSEFDVAAFLPQLDTLMGWVEMFLRLLVMAGPLLMLLFGLVYLLAPPKEANYSLGWRFWWSMASLDAWQFTHLWAGRVWSGLGLLLTLIMAFVCNAFRRMEPMEMVWAAAKSIVWELVLMGIACLAINIAVMAVFDKDGFRRKDYEEYEEE